MNVAAPSASVRTSGHPEAMMIPDGLSVDSPSVPSPQSNVVDDEGSLSNGSAHGSYQESTRFCTWRKHARDLYQLMFHVDLVWETPAAQLMPFITSKDGVATHTILCGTRTGRQEQSFLQLLNASLPSNVYSLDESVMPYCEATGEVGGYGMAPTSTGLKIERRMAHDGDVLTARYMHANPLLIASASSNANLYIFDWSRVSLNRFPNEPPRPRAPLPPNELSSNPTDEERIAYQRRMRELNAAVVEQDRWDRRTADGQHVLTLVGGDGPSDNVDWSTGAEGTLISGSRGRVCVWQVGNMSKEASRTVEPTEVFTLDDDPDARISAVNFLWSSPNEFVCSSKSGNVYYNDVRARQSSDIFALPTPATSVAVSPLDTTQLLVGGEDGNVYFFDLRNSSEPVVVERLHTDEVTSVQWCPHSRNLFASGGSDGNVCVYHKPTSTLLFKHAGHTDRIMDLGWNWQADCAGQLISADSNAIMLWRPRDLFQTT